MLSEIRCMLKDIIIPFWQGLIDKDHGGYYGYMDFDLNVDKVADKGCILNSRILWFFSKAYTCLGDLSLLENARHAYDFLVNCYLDKEYGGVYWSVTFDGKPSDDTKHTYNQAFVIYALAAYYEASRDNNALMLARQLFSVTEEKCRTPYGYGEAYDRHFHPQINEKLSENGVLAAYTMNTLLHVLEAYAGLYEVFPDHEVAERIREILTIFMTKIYNPDRRRLEVFFDENMSSILDLHSFGHDIESSWLLDWAASLLNDKALIDGVGNLTSILADNIYRTAFHKCSIWNECENGIPDKTRVWWVQAEGMVGFLNAYQKDRNNTHYLHAVCDIWEYIKEYFVDTRAGSEWFWDLNDDGIPISRRPIVEPWKCPYHNGRMCFELIKRNEDAMIY